MFLRASALALALVASAAASQAPAPAKAQSKTPSRAPAKTQPAAAPETRLRGPIKITAERAELERREYALYRGRVRLVSEDMVLTGDRLELRQPAKGQFEARLTGAPARLDHPGNEAGPPVSASAGQIIYDTRTATVDLIGGVQLAHGTDQLSSGSVRYNLAARRISANGSAAGQVHMVIQPPESGTPKPQKPQNTPPAQSPKKQ